MTRLIIATQNKGKVKEIKALLDGYNYEVLSLKEVGIHVDVVENGSSFEENSLIKARTIQAMTGGMVIADDSGIEIDFLNGRHSGHLSHSPFYLCGIPCHRNRSHDLSWYPGRKNCP